MPSYKTEIVEEKKNPLIDRVEVDFKVEHFGEGTPNRLELKEKIAAMKGSKIALTIIKEIKMSFGSTTAIGKAHIYERKEEMDFYEPFHIIVRNMPKEKRTEIYDLKKKNEPYKHLFNTE